MPIPQWVARFNRRVTNPINRTWAGYIPPLGILDNVGRKSGKRFRTPVSVFITNGGVVIPLTYGPNRDWLKNVLAAGGGHVKRRGLTFAVTDPRVMPREDVDPLVMGWWSKRFFAGLPSEQAVLLRRV